MLDPSSHLDLLITSATDVQKLSQQDSITSVEIVKE
jgi:hypothetical protein